MTGDDVVILLEFPGLHLLTRSHVSDVPRIDTPDLCGVAPYAVEAGLRDRSWRRTTGPETLAPSTDWFRGDLGGIACAVATDDIVKLHIFARDGTPLAIRRMKAAWAEEDADATAF